MGALRLVLSAIAISACAFALVIVSRAADRNFYSHGQANIELLGKAARVTEFEGPPMVDKPLLDKLLAAGVPADNFFGCRVLEAAARTREKDVVRRMLALGAPLQRDGQYGQTRVCDALAMAVEGGDPEIVKMVLARHPDPNWGAEPALVYILSAPGYVPGAKGPAAGSGLWAFNMRRDRRDVVRLLLAAGADPGRKITALGGDTMGKRLRALHDTEIDAQLDGWARDHGKKT